MTVILRNSAFLFVSAFGIIGFLSIRVPAQFPLVENFAAPTYPAAAIALRASGDVQVRVEVNETGQVTSAVALSGHRFLQKVSEIAAQKWVFSMVPGTHYKTLTFSFRLPERGVKENAVLRGHYVLEFTRKYYEIINTRSID
jgi:TonB family protein